MVILLTYVTDNRELIKIFMSMKWLGLRLICRHNFKNNRSQFWLELRMIILELYAVYKHIKYWKQNS